MVRDTAVRLLVPDDIIEELRPLLEAGDSVQWAVGDYLVGVVDELGPAFDQAYGVGRGRAEIHRQVAVKVGVTRDTIRDREVMARFWPDRRRYAPLTYSQLRACKGGGSKAREYAEWALANLPAPVTVIWGRVHSNGDDMPAWCARWERVQHLCQLIVEDSDTPEVIRGVCEGVVRLTESYPRLP